MKVGEVREAGKELSTGLRGRVTPLELCRGA